MTRRRRHRARRAEARARADQRPGHGRHPPRRRGLRARRGGRRRARRPRPDDRGQTPLTRAASGGPLERFHADFAWLGGERVVADVLIDGRGRADRVRVAPGVERAARARCACAGVTLPGLANAHSHAFQRALRGRTQRGGGLLDVARGHVRARRAAHARRLPRARARHLRARWRWPGSRAWASSTTCTGKLSEALIAAADEAGIRITLLDACYLAGGFGEPPNGAQARFTDGDADALGRARRRS